MIDKVKFIIKKPKISAKQFAEDKILDEGYVGIENIITGKLNKLMNKEIGQLYSESKKEDIIKNRGLYEIKADFEKEEIESLKDKVDKKMKKEKYGYHPPGRSLPKKYEEQKFYRVISSFKGQKMPHENMMEEFPEIKHILLKSRKEIKKCYGTNFKPIYANIKRTKHMPEEVVKEDEVYSNYWHLDGHPTDNMKLFVLLCDVDEDCGPLHLLNRKETSKVYESMEKRFDRKEHGVPNEYVEDRFQVKKFTGSTGDAILCNTNTNLHRAGNPKKGMYRDLLTIQLTTASSQSTAEDWEEQIKHGPVRGFDGLWYRI